MYYLNMIRMKTKFLLASCVLAAAVAGCQNEEFEAVNVGGQATSSLVEVGDNFMISGVGAVAPGTRTYWGEGTNAAGNKVLLNYFTPIIAGGNWVANTELGGTGVESPEIGACVLIGGSVYSNYQFYHYGWLATGQEKADFDICYPAKLNNGWLYSELTTTMSTAGEDAAMERGQFRLKGTAKTYNNESYAVSADDLNLNSGIYQTENKAMFAGDYVLYYPYNKDFTEGMIPATSKVAFNDVEKKDLGSLDVAENTFRYAYAPDMVGGTKAASFEFKNLSGIVKITVKGATDADLATPSIEKLMLYSEKDGFLTKVYLDPSAIAAGKEGTEIYASGNKETNKTILVNMETASNKLGKNDVVYISALPTTVSDLVVYAYANNKWAACEVGNFEIKAGTGVPLDVTYADDDFEDKYLAVDTESLIEAIKNAKANATAQKPATIEVLGNITLDAAKNTTSSAAGRYDIPPYITITGDKIVVPEDVMLVVNSGATIESAIDVEGKSCCTGTNGGALYVQKAGVLAGTVNVKAGYEGKKNASLTFNNYGTGTTASSIAATAEVNVEGTVTFEGATDIRGTLNIAEDATATVGSASNAADVNVRGGKVSNDGTFEVLNGKFAVVGAQGNSYTAADGENFTNNGKFIDNVGTTVGGATQHMTMGAEAQYICKVDDQARLDEAYKQKKACNLIQITKAITAATPGTDPDYYDFTAVEQHADKDVDVEVAATGVKFQPSVEVTIGNLSVTSGSLEIKETAYTPATMTEPEVYGYLHVNGDINIAASFSTAEDLIGMTADNLTVLENGTATFGKRTNVNDVTLAVDQTIEVQKGGTFTITDAASANAALITCKEIVDNGTFNGYPNVIE